MSSMEQVAIAQEDLKVWYVFAAFIMNPELCIKFAQ